MLVPRVFLSISFELLFFTDTVLKSIFMNWINFSCHRALIGCYLVGLEQNTIGWNLHTFVYLYNISHQNKILMHFDQLPVSYDWYSFSLINYRVKFHKLSLFLVVVYCCHCRWYCYSYKHCETFNPGCRSVIVVWGTDFDCDWDNTGNDQDS